MRFNWFWLAKVKAQIRKRTSSRGDSRRKFRPNVEQLEDRLVPANAYGIAQLLGGSPVVSIDAQGDLFIIQDFNGAYGDGAISEIAAGSNTLTTLASFNGTDGSGVPGIYTPPALIDPSGNLLGATPRGGAFGQGVVFELPQGSGTITVLASFDGPYGVTSMGPIVEDTNGDIFGTADAPYGELYELKKGSGQITVLSNGLEGTQGLTLDSHGDLYGFFGGDSGYNGGVFEVQAGSTSVTTLATLPGTPGLAYPEYAPTVDTNGDVFGITINGVIFELPHNSNSITQLAVAGGVSEGSVMLNNQGDLFGTVATSPGDFFELAPGTSTVTVLYSFGAFGANTGIQPETNLVQDSSGNIYGTTGTGGQYDGGAVWVYTNDSVSVSTNPTSQTAFAGSSVTFSAAAVGSPTPTVQWGLSTDGGNTFTPIPGATSTTYSFSATIAELGYEYEAVFTSGVAPVTTSAASLTVKAAPSIATEPSNQTAAAGTNVTFMAAASGYPSPSVQWEVSTNNGSTFANIAGSTSTSYSFTATAGESSNEYEAVFTNSLGTSTTTAATLTVDSITLTLDPTSQTVTAGSSVAFTASATGNPAPTVQWELSTNYGSTFAAVAGATSTSYSIGIAIGAENGYEYEAVFTSGVATETTSTATLTVDVPAPPSITTQPTNQVEVAGSGVTFVAAASGYPVPTVQWEYSTNSGSSFASLVGATSNSLSFTATAAANGYEYEAVFANSLGTATSTAVTLTVDSITITLNPTSQTVTAGSSVTFTASATGNPVPTVQWELSTNGGSTFAVVSGATSTSLLIASATAAENAYEYEAVFSSGVALATTSAATLTVDFPPTISANPSTQIVTAGTDVTFVAAASGYPAPTVQWQYSTNLGSSFAIIAGATSTSLSFAAGLAENGYEYQAVFTNSQGAATSSAASLTLLGNAYGIASLPAGGDDPQVSIDAHGNLFIITDLNGAYGDGAIYEIPAGSNTLATLASFNGTNGSGYVGTYTPPVLVDPNGDLFGTTPTGGAYGDGVVFELPAGSGTITALASFNGPYSVTSTGPIVEDASGNIFGTADAPYAGEVWELKEGSSQITVLASGLGGTEGLSIDSHGDMYGFFGGYPGGIFEVAAGSATVTTLASFNGSDGLSYPIGVPAVDSNGDVFGITQNDAAFELPQNSSSITLLALQSTGGAVEAGAMLDNRGDLFATVAAGGPDGRGELFELASGTSTFTLLYGFGAFGTNTGVQPEAGLVEDSSGNIYGTTKYGGQYDDGAAWVYTNDSVSVTTNPTNQTVLAGGGATFSAAATGNPTPTVQWDVSTDGGNTFTSISGATSTTYSFSATIGELGYEYEAVFMAGVAPAVTSAASLTVKAAPSIATEPSNQTAAAGTNVTFMAAATGYPVPTVQWMYSTNQGSSFANIVGATSASYSFAPSAAANGYEYEAVFTNSFGTASSTAATLTVDSITLTMDPTSQTVTAGSSVTFTAAAAGSPAPTVQWELSSNGGSSFAVISGATSTSYSFSAGGADNGYEFEALFTSGLATASTTAATLTVDLFTPSISTTLSTTSVSLGTSPVTLNDTADLTGGDSPTGSITFTLYLGSSLLDTETVAVTGDGTYATPTPYTLPTTGTVTGTYEWDASYSGDANNNPVSDINATNEQVVVSAASPTLSTTPSAGTVALGATSSTLNDTADLTGAYSPTGTITFTLYLGSTKVDTETVAVSSNGNYTTPTGYTLPASGTVTGTYQWDASYSGDANDAPATGLGATDEQVVVSAASPSITTTPNTTTETLGTELDFLNDTADLTGGYAPTGSITFTLYQGTSLLYTQTVAVSGNGAYSSFFVGTAFPPPASTVYQWDASYDGDGNNTAATDNNSTAEQVLWNAASPSITTTLNTTTVTLGTSAATLNDTADLTGGFGPTGTITFTLFQGTSLLNTETVAVSGDGNYTTPTGYTLPSSGAVTGTYQWDASYGGDDYNSSATDIDSATERVVVGAASPTITTTPSPSAVTQGTSSVTLKDTADLTGGYIPAGSITFTLYQGTRLLDTEAVAVSGNGNYTTPTGYTLPTSGGVSGTYQWDASYTGDSNNTGATDSSNPAEQVAVDAVTISTNPSNQTVTAGQSTTFTAAAIGYPTPTVQWELSTNSGSSFAPIAGATSTSYSITTTAAENGDEYEAVFTAGLGSATTTVARLTVDFAPTVASQPSSRTITAGNSVTFTAAATANPAATVQWQLSTNGGSTFSNISGATSTTYTFTTNAGENGDEYEAVFTNGVSSASTSAATLTVDFTPTITTNPISQTVTAGNNVTFTAAATANPAATVQWEVSSNGGSTFSNISGTTSTTYIFTANAGENGDEYKAVFTNGVGSLATSAATLTVDFGPTITTQPSSQTVSVGTSVMFTAAASGNPATSVQWEVSSNGGSSFSNVSGATSTGYSFAAISSENGDEFKAVFTNGVGSLATSAATLTADSVTITTQPSSHTVMAGNSVTFTAAASGIPAAPTVQWEFSSNGGSSFSNISGATSTSYSFSPALAADNGFEYKAVFTEGLATATTAAATLTVDFAPTIATNPSSQTVTAGSSVTFTASASGNPAPTVQWEVSSNGGSTFSNISGATSTSYVFAASASENGDEFKAVFSNSVGSATTSAATLTISGQYTEIFVIGTSQEIYSQKFDNSSGAPTTGFVDTTGGSTGFAQGYAKAIAVSTTASGQYEVFVIGTDSHVYYQLFDTNGNATTGFNLLGGNATALAVGKLVNGDPELFAIGTDSQVYYMQLNANGTPTTGQFIVSSQNGSAFATAIAVGSYINTIGTPTAAPELFVVGTNTEIYDQLLTTSGTNATAGGATNFTPTSASSPGYGTALAVGQLASGAPELFAIGTSSEIYYQLFSTNGTSSSNFAPTAPTQPGYGKALDVIEASSGPELFAIGTDNGIYYQLFAAANGAPTTPTFVQTAPATGAAAVALASAYYDQGVNPPPPELFVIGSNTEIYYQLFNAAGTPNTAAFQLTDTTNPGYGIAIAAGNDPVVSAVANALTANAATLSELDAYFAYDPFAR